MTMRTLIPQPLTKSAFAAFGDVIEVSDNEQHFTINHGFTERYNDLARIDVHQRDGHTLLSIFRSNPLPQPTLIKCMERHPLSSQTFMPLSNTPYLVAVAPPGDLDEAAIAVFIAGATQGVNYYAGTWHHFTLALAVQSDFLVIDRGGKEVNCDEVNLSQSIEIVLDEHTP